MIVNKQTLALFSALLLAAQALPAAEKDFEDLRMAVYAAQVGSANSGRTCSAKIRASSLS